ncbi:5'-flap endonuclease [Pleosporales sp. CAS-2024a]
MPAPRLLALSPSASPNKRVTGASTHPWPKADMPPEATRGFATVGSLVRSEHFAQPFDDTTTGRDQDQSTKRSLQAGAGVAAPKIKSKKRAVAGPCIDDDPKPKPKPRTRKPKAADLEATTLDPELRLPPRRVSPFFATESADVRVVLTPTDDAPKLTKAGKPRKARAKKEKTDGEAAGTKLRKPRATKSQSAKTTHEACIESAHFSKSEDANHTPAADAPSNRDSPTTADTNAHGTSIWDVPSSPGVKKKRVSKPRAPRLRETDSAMESLDLDEAVARRRDWTPPCDTTIATPFTDSVGKENKQDDADDNNGGFTHMISNFAYAQGLPAQVASTVADATTAMAVTKRRRVELNDVPGNTATSRNSSPEKGKAPKKKPRTITDIATEQYQSKNVELDPSDVSSEFFHPQTTVTKVPLNDVPENGEALPKKTRKRLTAKKTSDNDDKSGQRPKSKKASTKASAKPKPIAEKLLSPGSALMRMDKQDLLFGTSSQLALEDSPTAVRQLQQALRESELLHANDLLGGTLVPPPRWPKFDKIIGKRSLWEASSRDVQGGLLEHEADVYLPDFDRTQDYPLLMDGTHDQLDAVPLPPAVTHEPRVIEPVIISSDLPTPARPELPPSRSFPNMESSDQDHMLDDSIFEDIDDFDHRPPPSNQNAESQNGFADIDDILPISKQRTPTAPPKHRPPASPPMPLTLPSKKPRGRPPKSHPAPSAAKASISQPMTSASRLPSTPNRGSGRFIDIDEIFDSEDEYMQALSPTPPRNHTFKTSDPLPLFCATPSAKKHSSKSVNPDVVRVQVIPAAHLEWSAIKSSVFQSISSHIRSLEPTRSDPKKPSWHEKILMYEPLVLEDLTAYLNASQIAGVRTWKRATKVQTKAWNQEMKALGQDQVGIIEGDGDVLAIEKELEPVQVQAWCESMSVCCVWGEGRGKSGVRKGLY